MVSGDLTFESSELVVDGCLDNLQRKKQVCIRQVTGTRRAQCVVRRHTPPSHDRPDAAYTAGQHLDWSALGPISRYYAISNVCLIAILLIGSVYSPHFLDLSLHKRKMSGSN